MQNLTEYRRDTAASAAAPVFPVGIATAAKPRRRNISRSEISPLAALAHDGRNVMAALRLCSELVAEPDVLTPKYRHYADEIRSVCAAGMQLLQQISALADAEAPAPFPVRLLETSDLDETLGETVVEDLPSAVRQMLPLLSAVTGPGIRMEMECLSCPGQARISPENLTRVLMNLVRNAADAMKRGGHVRITVQQAGGASFHDASFDRPPSNPTALICVQDNGPGIAPQIIDHIFESGFSTRQTDLSWPRMPHRGFGLSIVRSLVEAAGGRVCAVSLPNRGTRFEIELPLTNVTAVTPAEPRLLVEGGCR